ncbi:MAG: amidohydrolase family protein, partial [Gammaproteobacteria bacterium]
MNDLLIRGAMVYDGSGAPGCIADVAVKEGRIISVEPIAAPGAPVGSAHARTTATPGNARPPAAACQVVDAAGLALMPGIVDNHTHYDAQVTWDPFCTPSPALGVTTAVIGNCGFTIAPCRPADRDITMRNLTQVEGMSLDVLRQGIDWQFESVPEYLDFLERRGSLVNLAAFVGHSSLRTFVMGPDAATRAATDDEIERMAGLVREAMRTGAVGFATSTNEPHNGEGGTCGREEIDVIGPA